MEAQGELYARVTRVSIFFHFYLRVSQAITYITGRLVIDGVQTRKKPDVLLDVTTLPASPFDQIVFVLRPQQEV